MKETLVVNLYGAPGSGKSTGAAYIFAELKMLGINCELITEFASDEKREIIAYNNLPQQMIDALITREDNVFFSHNGLNLKAILRGVVGILTGRSLGGDLCGPVDRWRQ